MNQYRVLENNVVTRGRYSLVPIRFEDRISIMNWRNEQIYHLRQNSVLTLEDQDHYFENVVSKLYDQEKPNQILFSLLEDGLCIGYGGLVHINWIDRNAELSFIMDTSLEMAGFEKYWHIFLRLIEEVAFKDLELHKIYTYAFDLRPHLYVALSHFGYLLDARLDEHCLFNGEFIDVFIHAKIGAKFHFTKALDFDVNITFEWAKNSLIRKYALCQDEISLDTHQHWFSKKISDSNSAYYIVNFENQQVGSLRIDVSNNKGIISYLLDPEWQGKGLGIKILKGAEDICHFIDVKPFELNGIVHKDNHASVNLFEKLNYNKEVNGDLYIFKKVIE